MLAKSACCGLAPFTKHYWSLSEARLFNQLVSRLVHIHFSAVVRCVLPLKKSSQHSLLQHGNLPLISWVSLIPILPARRVCLAGWVRCSFIWDHGWIQICVLVHVCVCVVFPERMSILFWSIKQKQEQSSGFWETGGNFGLRFVFCAAFSPHHLEN